MDAKELNLDVSADGARALHRVVRAMHDGHCPSCGYLAPAGLFEVQDRGFRGMGHGFELIGHRCPSCNFKTTWQEEQAALAAFRPHFLKSVEVFEAWRNGRPLPV